MDLFQDVGPKNIENLLNEVDNGFSVLPDFQRSFVWDPSQTLSLLISVAKGYPAGSILRVQDTKYEFSSRHFEEVDADKAEPKHMFLVLDGQQRLTSLYHALYGKGEFRYFVDLRKLGELGDIGDEDVIFFERAKSKRAKHLAKGIQEQVEDRVFPLAVLFGEGFLQWQNEATTFVPEDELQEFKQLMLDFNKKHLKNLENYQFPVVTLNSSVSVDALCTIFETINRTGVKLKLFELMTARFFKDGVNLRTKWETALESYPLFGEDLFDIDPYCILQAIAMKVSPTHSCKRQTILGLTLSELNANWDDACAGLNDGLAILREDCKVLNRRWLATPSMLGPLAALMIIDKPKSGKEFGERRAQVRRWLWCAIFSQRYQAAANTRSEKDVGEMVKWFNGGPTPTVISSFSVDDVSLRDASSPSSPVYKGVICLALQNGARDFAHLGIITEQMMAVGEVDDHHIFPKKYLETKGLPKSEINCVLNRTLIDSTTNKTISSHAPSVYLPMLNLEKDEEKILESHLIPVGSSSGLYMDDFEKFIEEREAILIQQIVKVTS